MKNSATYQNSLHVCLLGGSPSRQIEVPNPEREKTTKTSFYIINQSSKNFVIDCSALSSFLSASPSPSTSPPAVAGISASQSNLRRRPSPPAPAPSPSPDFLVPSVLVLFAILTSFCQGSYFELCLNTVYLPKARRMNHHLPASGTGLCSRLLERGRPMLRIHCGSHADPCGSKLG